MTEYSVIVASKVKVPIRHLVISSNFCERNLKLCIFLPKPNDLKFTRSKEIGISLYLVQNRYYRSNTKFLHTDQTCLNYTIIHYTKI